MQIIQDKLNQTKEQMIQQLNSYQFIKISIYYLATVCGFVVGVIQFSIRAFNENNCAERMRIFFLNVVRFVIETLIDVEEKLDADVPVVEVAQ